jgi:hypothetical protein
MDKSTVEFFERILKEMQEEEQHQKHNAGGAMTAQQLHGLGGVFSQLGADPEFQQRVARLPVD